MMVQETPLLLYQGHEGHVNALCWSPDSRYLASASNDQTVHIWEVRSGEQLVAFRGHQGPVEAVAWSHQGSLIASGGWDKTVQVWHALSGEVVRVYQGHSAWIRKALAWSLMTRRWPQEAGIARSSSGMSLPDRRDWCIEDMAAS